GPERGDDDSETGDLAVAEPPTSENGSPQPMRFAEGADAPAPRGAAPPPAAGEEIEVARTPQGARRGEAGITESEEIDYKLPSGELLTRGGKEDPGPDTRDREAVGRTLIETLASFGVDAEIVGTVIGPH